MSFFYWQTTDGGYIGHISMQHWPVRQKYELNYWIEQNLPSIINYGNGLFEFQTMEDVTTFILTWT